MYFCGYCVYSNGPNWEDFNIISIFAGPYQDFHFDLCRGAKFTNFDLFFLTPLTFLYLKKYALDNIVNYFWGLHYTFRIR